MPNRLRIGTKIGASFALGLALFGAIAITSYQGIQQLINQSKWERHTFQVLDRVDQIDTSLSNAESNLGDYLLSGDAQSLDSYDVALQALNREVRELRRLTADNLSQQRRLDQLEPLIADRIALMKERIIQRRQEGLAAVQAAALRSGNPGKQLTEQILKLTSALENEEQRLLLLRSAKANSAAQQALDSITYGVPVYCVLLSLIGFTLARNIARPLRKVSSIANLVGEGDLSVRVPMSDRQDEIGALSNAFNQMIDSLRDTTQKNRDQNWLNSNLAEFTQMLQGQRHLESVTRIILSKVTPLVEAQQGVFYILDTSADPPVLRLLSSYAYQEREQSNQFYLGEGLVGQCALEKQRILLTDVPSGYIRIGSGLGEASPLNIVVLPVLFESQVIAVIELASFRQFSEIHLTFLDQVSESVGVVLNTIAANTRTSELLKQAQELTEELQHQQEELQESNRRLEEQAYALQSSEVLLKEQQEELQQTNEELQQLNEELEEKAELLTTQKRKVERKNQEIEQARQAIAQKAEELSLSSRYKSEFLANMSHELRTPLNSLLILARLLSDNRENNLSQKQVEYSRTIYAAGIDLLELINDILDLAKIESGMMSVNLESVLFADLQADLERTFEQIAQDKGLAFKIELDPDLPPAIVTDSQRIQQILKNLLANSFKFTDRGTVMLRIAPTLHCLSSNQPEAVAAIAFAVIDTGIGIPIDQQKVIFEAFQQADGTTSRKYGGTGLGLSISRELAQMLGGAIELVSQPRQGSMFTLYLPPVMTQAQVTLPSPKQNLAIETRDQAPDVRNQALDETTDKTYQNMAGVFPEVLDDRTTLQPTDRTLLIIEDDANFAQILTEMSHHQGFKVLMSHRGYPGLALAREFQPDAIMLDIRLPDIEGWSVLDRLKHHPSTRHIPVHILSIDQAQRGLQLGAIAYLQKPVSPEALNQALIEIKGYVERQVKYLLVVEDDPRQSRSIIDLIGNSDVQITAVGTGAEALAILRLQMFDCVVLDLGLPDMTGFELIEQIKQQENLVRLPIIIYTGKELTQTEETHLKRLAETIIIKDVRSPERLLDETALFLHRVQANLPQPQRQMLEQVRQTDPVLANKKVLIVDDDVRNIFALTGLLERYQMQVFYAENGRDGIAALQNHPNISVVLMDVMMPEMDGYETTQAIRQLERFRSLPIIALTAKAMQGDREKCIESGASDYITKPVDTEQLLSLLRVWLYGRD